MHLREPIDVFTAKYGANSHGTDIDDGGSMQNVEIPNSSRFRKAAELAELSNKQTTLKAKQDDEHEATKDLDELTSDSSALQHSNEPLDHSEQNSNPPGSAINKCTELEI